MKYKNHLEPDVYRQETLKKVNLRLCEFVQCEPTAHENRKQIFVFFAWIQQRAIRMRNERISCANSDDDQIGYSKRGHYAKRDHFEEKMTKKYWRSSFQA